MGKRGRNEVREVAGKRWFDILLDKRGRVSWVRLFVLAFFVLSLVVVFARGGYSTTILISGNNSGDANDANITEDGYVENAYTRYNTSSTIYIGDLAGPPGDRKRGYIEFNTSVIPDTATIDEVWLNISVSAVASTDTCNITQMGFRPSGLDGTTGGQGNIDLDADIGNGTAYNSSGTWCFSTGWHNINLSLANSDLQNLLSADWFAIGMKTSENPATDEEARIDSSESSLSPELWVTYTAAPTIEITHPTNMSYNYVVGDINYTVDAVTGGTGDVCWYSLNDGTANSTSVSAGTNFTSVTSAEGQSNWSVWCNDTSSNEGTASVVFIQDTSTPSTTIIYPANTTYTYTVGNLNYTIDDVFGSGGDSCWYSTNNGNSNSTFTNAGTNFTSVSSVEGSNNYTLYCNDTANNEITSSVVFAQIGTDDLPPNVTNMAENKSYAVAGEIINFSVSVADDVQVSDAWLSHNFDITEKESTGKIYSSTAYYAIGNKTYRGTNFVFAQNYYATTLCINIRNGTGITGDIVLEIRTANGTLPTSNILANATLSKNLINATYQNLCVNFTKPALLQANTSYFWVASSPDSSLTTAYRLGYILNWYTGRMVLSINNGTSWGAGPSNIDFAFNVSVSSFDWKNETLVSIGAASQDTSFVKTLYWALNSSFLYSWCANDTLNQENCSFARNYNVYESSITDNIFPSGSILSPPNSTKINGNLTIRASVSDDFGISYTSFQYSNATYDWTNITNCEAVSGTDCLLDAVLFSNDTEGYEIRIMPCDIAGNCNTSTEPKHYIIDRTIPTDAISVIYPESQGSAANASEISITINTTDGSGAGINDTGVLIDLSLLNTSLNSSMNIISGEMATNEYSVWNISLVLSGAETGSLEIPFYVYDNASTNNLLYSTLAVQIDNLAPTWDEQSASQEIVYNSTEITFQVHAFDNLNLSYFIFTYNFSGDWVNETINFTEEQELEAYAGFTKTMDTEGNNWTYYFMLYDDAGNLNQTDEANISILSLAERDELVVALVSPVDGANSSSVDQVLTFNYTNGTASYCAVYVDNEFNSSDTGIAENTSFSFNVYGLVESEHDWYVECNTSLEDIYAADIRAFTIDITPPNITNIASSPGSSTATITWDTDEDSDSSVYYGITDNTISSTTNSSLTSTHSTYLTGLSSSSTYYYNVSSCDNVNNCNTSTQGTFSTSASGTTTTGGGGGGGGGGGIAVCTPNWLCSTWSICNKGEQTRICSDSGGCFAEKIETKQCCTSSWQCEWSQCEQGYSYATNCADLNKCGIEADKQDKKRCGECASLDCGEWSDCKASYTYEDILAGNLVSGKQTRICSGTGNCETEIEYKECNLKVDVLAKKVERCNETYVEIYTLSGELVSRLKESYIGNFKKIDVSFIEAEGYCEHCFNKVQDYDETGADCGGSCIACASGRFKIPIILIILTMLAIIIYLSLLYEEERRKWWLV